MTSRIDFYNDIAQTLYEQGAGNHLDAQIRADYRRELASVLYDTLYGPSQREFLPVVEHVDISVTVRDDEPMAVLRLADVLGDHREINMRPNTALHTAVGLLKFVEQVSG